jgi:acetamidase/formamidase
MAPFVRCRKMQQIGSDRRDSGHRAGIVDRSAARNATLNMIDFLVKTKGLTREQAYILVSVAVDLNIAQLVDVPNLGVTAILNRDVFKPQ